MDLISKTIKNFLEEFNITQDELIYLVAFSGGYDSMCLLHALQNVCKNKIVAIHLNHNWRGAESDLEEQNCRAFCELIGVDFYSEKLPDDVEKNETVAREERYKFFEKCAEKFNSEIIFTAHNKNDNAETLLYRIVKGTGITGLQGIMPKRGIYYRPLLEIERKDIEDYCSKNNLKPNNDSSNGDIIHNRNLIRQNVLPELFKINPTVITSINRLSQSACEATEIIKDYLSIINSEICKDGKYNTNKFLNLSRALQMRVLYEIISPLLPQNYDRERIEILYDFIIKNRTSKSGKICSVTSGYDLFVSDKYFEIISQKESENLFLKIDKCGEYYLGNLKISISECDKMSEKMQKDGRIIYADLSDYDFNFELRTRQEGDIIQPFGMKGHQKLKKYLNSKKIPNHEKDSLILIAKESEIIVVCGVGTSDKIRVKTKPTHKIEIEGKYGN